MSESQRLRRSRLKDDRRRKKEEKRSQHQDIVSLENASKSVVLQHSQEQSRQPTQQQPNQQRPKQQRPRQQHTYSHGADSESSCEDLVQLSLRLQGAQNSKQPKYNDSGTCSSPISTENDNAMHIHIHNSKRADTYAHTPSPRNRLRQRTRYGGHRHSGKDEDNEDDNSAFFSSSSSSSEDLVQTSLQRKAKACPTQTKMAHAHHKQQTQKHNPITLVKQYEADFQSLSSPERKQTSKQAHKDSQDAQQYVDIQENTDDLWSDSDGDDDHHHPNEKLTTATPPTDRKNPTTISTKRSKTKTATTASLAVRSTTSRSNKQTTHADHKASKMLRNNKDNDSNSSKAGSDDNYNDDIISETRNMLSHKRKKEKRKRHSSNSPCINTNNRATHGSLPTNDNHNSHDRNNQLNQQYEESFLSKLKPEFTNPKLGPPTELVPLVLVRAENMENNGDTIVDDDDDKKINGSNRGRNEYNHERKRDNEEDEVLRGIPTEKDSSNNNHASCTFVNDKVPPSINRYLQQYQREGIQFMYEGISKHQGVILGHDMGMGKTIQVIALLAALLHKRGDGRDAREMQKHSKNIDKQLHQQRVAQEQALLHGRQIQASCNDAYDNANAASNKSLTHNDPGCSSRCKTSKKDNANINKDDKNNNTGNTQSSEYNSYDIGRRARAPILIVVPSSVIENWKNELELWGHFSVSLYQSSNRSMALEQIRNGTHEIMVCSRSLVQRLDDHEALSEIPWKFIIIDELHQYKNQISKGYIALQTLKKTTGCTMVGLTGTIMPNDHHELYNLIDLVQPNFLGPWAYFRNHVVKPLKYGRTIDAKEDTVQMSKQRSGELNTILKPIYQERKKESVQELQDILPEKDEKVVFCELSPLQKRVYEYMLTLPDFTLLKKANAPCDCGVNKAFFVNYKKMRNSKEKMEYRRNHIKEVVPRKECCYSYPINPHRMEPHEPWVDPKAVIWKGQHENDKPCPQGSIPNCPFCILLPALQKLYKLSSHAALLQVDSDPKNFPQGSTIRAEKQKVLNFAKVALPEDVLSFLPGGSYVREDGIMDNHMLLSGKMAALDQLLNSCSDRNDRILLFSYSTTTLDLIQNYVKAQGHSFLRLDGSTPTTKRQGLIDCFQNDKTIFLFLISTLAGGLGLNLTAANVVIVFDVNWNPSYDEQAQDRAYRIGQSRNVQVIRLVSRGTIEELKYIRQLYKVQLKQETLISNNGNGGTANNGQGAARLFRGVAGDKWRKGELFGSENLLKYQDGSFMADLWKSSDKKRSTLNNSGAIEMTRTEDIAKALLGMSVDQVDQIGALDDNNNDDDGGIIATIDSRYDMDAVNDTEVASPQKKYKKSSENNNDHGIAMVNEGNAVNHGDFLRGDRGVAALSPSEEGFVEVMSGYSQVAYSVLEQAEVGYSQDREGTPENSNVNSCCGDQTRPESSVTTPILVAPNKVSSTHCHMLDSIPEDDTTNNQNIQKQAILPVIHDMAELLNRTENAKEKENHDYSQDTVPISDYQLPKEEKIVDESLSTADEEHRDETIIVAKGKNAEVVLVADTNTTSTEEMAQKKEEACGPSPTKKPRVNNNVHIHHSSENESARVARRRSNMDVRIMGISRKKLKGKKQKSKFSVADIIGKRSS